MSVSHCPLCPLIFQFRSEVEYHLRNDHRSRADEELELRDELRAAQDDLTWERLTALHFSASEPSVSLLLHTTPAPAMTSVDAARLRHLADKARRRLTHEKRGVDFATLEHRLAKAVVAAEEGRTNAGIAVLVSLKRIAIIRLPIKPVERVVVDPTFATRDLFDALQSSPPYRVAFLDTRPRIFEGGQHLLTEVSAKAAAIADTTPHPRGIGRADAGRSEVWLQRHSRLQAVLRMTDDALDERKAKTTRMPLIIVGSPRQVSLFHRRSRHKLDVIGDVRRLQSSPSAADLQRVVDPIVKSWQRQLAQEQASRFERAAGNCNLEWGVETAMSAVLLDQVEHLWVQRGYMLPARTLSGGTLEIVNNPETPGINDDIVDDLIELAASKGIPTDIVQIDLPNHVPSGVAVQLRSAASNPTLMST